MLMKLPIYIKLPVLFLLLLLTSKCAKVGSPSGGLRDRTPPVVLKTVPEAFSTNFKGRRLIITFDEYVTVNNINENLIVSPPLSSRPKVWLRGKSVIVDMTEDLKEDFTYTFNFQDAIRDLNEGNILEGYQFVFATGNVVDSLSITGNVYYAENLEIPEKIHVLVHSNHADTAVKRTMPDYIGMVDRFGYFRINNVRAGSFQLYALKDADNNRRYNLVDEEFAFLSYPIEVSADSSWIPKDTIPKPKPPPPPTRTAAGQNTPARATDTIALEGRYKLLMFKKALTAQYLRSSQRSSKNMLEFAFSMPTTVDMPAEFSLPNGAENSFIAEHTANRDTLLVWLTDSTLIETNPLPARIKYPFTDSTSVVVYKTDTLNLRFTETARAPQRGAAVTEDAPQPQPPLTVHNNFSSGIKPGDRLVLRSEAPFVEADTTIMRLFEISESDTLQIPFLLQKDSVTATKYIIESELSDDKKYLFVADSGAFSDIYSKISDSIGINFSLKSVDLYGKLSFNIQNVEEAVIVQLLSKDETKVIAEERITKNGKVEFPLLEPAIYRAKIIFDIVDDSKWTTGDFEERRQPESVTYYPDEIDVKAKFEIEQDWDAGARNEKNQKLRAAPARQ
jgi:hypothetical protein